MRPLGFLFFFLLFMSDTVLQEDAVNTLHRLDPIHTYHKSDLPELRNSMSRCMNKYIYDKNSLIKNIHVIKNKTKQRSV